MSRFNFISFMDYEDGKIAQLETIGDNGIPVNVFIDNAADFGDIEEGLCSIEVYAVGQNFQIYESKDSYYATEPKMDVISMIPMGTFPIDSNSENFEQSPHILFTGVVLEVQQISDSEENEPNYCVLIETLDMTFSLYCRYAGLIEKGYVIHGVAWLFGDLEMHCGGDEANAC